MVWVSTCNHENLLSAVGEHGAVFLGYAKSNTPSQIYTCHKINEYGIGLPLSLEGSTFVQNADFAYNLPDKQLSTILGAIATNSAFELEKAAKYYQALV
mmetsp:Transcript_40315/g.52790  ORF Transcript_40315/g.52790 Transcript_40315/m.52790 type:complete len:99 (-) Transcript_40315:274-570(-)|eukprot:CAMPEP_0185591770 /NCGR_PEP_ID=MMETSP0434-20130131/65634_1 /TAXON_ID=626734 ORGANISM="Favella taraikaensis, Strain Fe Narragansett Bay" /NCGR_SAMPLE_ID=MMETSP0434 /ASSEMBLY_ACC=CAM_ASM_000379 /LENGTH=98 /DNA_ID=CAMNT_0028217057 /DNA_START=640 /DNA_END=936 /DNA_ORIENTATION=+